jgi:hypothetical protein
METAKYTVDGLDKIEYGPFSPLAAINSSNGETLNVHASQFSPLLFQPSPDLPEYFETWDLIEDTIPVYDLAVSSGHAKKYIGFHFVVPTYQRGYRWEEDMVREFVDDVYLNYKKYYEKIRKVENESGKLQYAYCIQPMVVAAVKKHLNCYRVIDGQQRLTTLSLLLIALQNLVPSEAKSKNAHISISYESRSESGKYLFGIAQKCQSVLDDIRKNAKQYPSIKEKIEQSKKMLEEPETLDARYMLNTYLYAYWFFWERIHTDDVSSEYFSFAAQAWNIRDNPEPKRFALLEDMLLNLTSVIWHKIETDISDEQQEQKVFENFNAGKIELTNAELIKGIFMNPDNYLDRPDDSLFQKLETRKIMMGSQWDDIERELHNPHIWDFIPHLTSPDGSEKYPATRIDAILNMYVYFNQSDKTAFNFVDEKYSYKEIANIVNERLKSAAALNGSEKTENMFTTMFNLWNDIRKVFAVFIEWYNGDPSLENMNSIYHRISLLKRIILNTRQSHEERYNTELREIKNLYNELKELPKDVRIATINEIIQEKLLGTSGNCADFIRSIAYDTNPAAVENVLLAFNLATLEKAKGYGGRFPFFTFKDEKWEKEHVFATRTELSGKKLLEEIVSVSEIQAYKDYMTFLKTGNRNDDAGEDADAAGYSGTMVFSEYEALLAKIRTVLDNSSLDEQNEQIADLLSKEGPIIKLLADMRMGNMALLPKTNNIIVGNKPFSVKCEAIKQMFKNGDFIPICTMNVFSGFYDDKFENKNGMNGYTGHYLYQKRLGYIMEMTSDVSKYLARGEGKND